MLNISPIVRLTYGLVLLTISLLLVGDLFGLMPKPNNSELNSRKSIAEVMAIQASSDVARDDIATVFETMKVLQQRNEHILSVGLRRAGGQLVAVAGAHSKQWESPGRDLSTITHIQVPIFGDIGHWGTLEVLFVPLDSTLSRVLGGKGSVITLIIFISLSGFVAYWLFLKRALSELNPSDVIPERVRTALDVLTEGLVILDLQGRIVLANSTFCDRMATSLEKLMGKSLDRLNWVSECVTESDKTPLLPWAALVHLDDPVSLVPLKLRLSSNDVLSFAVSVAAIKAPDGQNRGLVVTFKDLTELEHKHHELQGVLAQLELSQDEIKKQNIELQILATRDPLTDVLNRRSFFESLDVLTNEATEEHKSLSCIMIDLDHFKSINDRFGHATGDIVIKLLAKILKEHAREGDLVARYGGEEFCVALPGADESHAAEVAERIRVAIFSEHHKELDKAFRVSASIGVSGFQEQKNSTELVDTADKALYVAKESGRNRVVCWSQAQGLSKPANETTLDAVDSQISHARKSG